MYGCMDVCAHCMGRTGKEREGGRETEVEESGGEGFPIFIRALGWGAKGLFVIVSAYVDRLK